MLLFSRFCFFQHWFDLQIEMNKYNTQPSPNSPARTSRFKFSKSEPGGRSVFFCLGIWSARQLPMAFVLYSFYLHNQLHSHMRNVCPVQLPLPSCRQVFSNMTCFHYSTFSVFSAFPFVGEILIQAHHELEAYSQRLIADSQYSLELLEVDIFIN